MSRQELAAAVEDYASVKFKDGNGFALKEYVPGLKRFGSSEHIVCQPYNARFDNDKLYEDSLLILDFLWSAEIIIPKINNTYIWGRSLKPAEEDAEYMPQRIVNGLVAHRRGVATPRIIAFTEGKGKRMFTEFHGAENLMSALDYRIDNFDIKVQKRLSIDALAFWKEEGRLRQKFKNVPHITKLCERDVKDEMAWREKLEKKYQHQQVVPYWVDSVEYMIEARRVREKIRKEWREDIVNYIKLHEKYSQSMRSVHKNKKHPNEKIKDICIELGRRLRESSEKGVLLLDVAPRDIIIDENLKPWFADMENLEFYEHPLGTSAQKRQIEAVRNEFIQPARKHFPYTKRDLLRIIEKAYYE